jgi:hypothetical protein
LRGIETLAKTVAQNKTKQATEKMEELEKSNYTL